jgi:hypothetical protein
LPQAFPTGRYRRQAAPSSAAWSRSVAGLLRCWLDPRLGRKITRGAAHRRKASSKLRRRWQPTLGCLHHQRLARCCVSSFRCHQEKPRPSQSTLGRETELPFSLPWHRAETIRGKPSRWRRKSRSRSIWIEWSRLERRIPLRFIKILPLI